MQDEDDPQDISGLILAKEPIFHSLPIIFLTAYGDKYYDYLRRVLGDEDSRRRLVDFVCKADGPEEILKAVNRAFTIYVNFDQGLDVQYQSPLNIAYLVGLLEPSLAPEYFPERIEELDGVLRQLFTGYQQILMTKELTHDAGLVLLAMLAHSQHGLGRYYLVALGLTEVIRQELTGYENYIKNQIIRAGRIEESTLGWPHYAGLVYTFGSVDLTEWQTLTDFSHNATVDELLDLLNDLFKVALVPWHKLGQNLQDRQSANALYAGWLGLSREAVAAARLHEQADALCREAMQAGVESLGYHVGRLTLYGESEVSFNLAEAIPDLLRGDWPFESHVPCSLSYGSLNDEAVLVTPKHHAWLVRFARIGERPLPADFVSMEAALLFDLMPTADLHTYAKFHDLLVSGWDPSANLIEEVPLATSSATQAVAAIRKQFVSRTKRNVEFDLYLSGLLWLCAHRLSQYDPAIHYPRLQLKRWLRVLLTLCLVTNHLRQLAEERLKLPEEAFKSLWLEVAEEVAWVEGERVKLTPQEFKVMCYLWEHNNEQCSVKDVVEGALREKHDDSNPKPERERFDAMFRRLRLKIQPEHRHYQYLIREHRKGIKLVIRGH